MTLFQVRTELVAEFYVDAPNPGEAKELAENLGLDAFEGSEIEIYADEAPEIPVSRYETIYCDASGADDWAWLRAGEYKKVLEERRKVEEKSKPLQKEQLPGMENL